MVVGAAAGGKAARGIGGVVGVGGSFVASGAGAAKRGDDAKGGSGPSKDGADAGGSAAGEGSGELCHVRDERATGRSTARKAISSGCPSRANARLTCWPAAKAVSAWATSSALRKSTPSIARTSSPTVMPAVAAGPPTATSEMAHLPGSVDSATCSPIHPVPRAGEEGFAADASGSVKRLLGSAGSDGDGAAGGGGISVRGAANGSGIGSPMAISPGSKPGLEGSAFAASSPQASVDTAKMLKTVIASRAMRPG
jgi:hypothetical protein